MKKTDDQFALRVGAPGDYAYLADVIVEENDNLRLIYTREPAKALLFSTGSSARDYRERDAMPKGAGRVVKV